MSRDPGIAARLGRAFFQQAAFIGVAAVVGVFVAGLLLEGLLIREALRNEADHFWELRAARPDFPLPNTQNLTGYMDDAPATLRTFESGYHPWRVGSVNYVVYVSERGGRRLYLAFDRSGVNRLAIYYGLAPLAIVLLVLYLSTWLGFRASQRALSPLLGLAREVRQLDLKAPDPAAFAPDRIPASADVEVHELAAALARFAQRMNDFVDRERHFTRDASHELRSPLTVIRASSELLHQDRSLDPQSQRAVARIQRAARDMEELTSAFLLLARETETGLPTESVNVNDVVAHELERARPLAEGRPVELEVDARCNLVLPAPEKIVSILIGNLVRNAVAYTERGHVRIEIDATGVVIEDTGPGMSAERIPDMYRPFVRGETQRSGFGVGLTIVRRISYRFGWPVDFDSAPGRGTRVRVGFPTASVVTPPAP
jgi:signal transduction histidine kinase